MPCIIQNAVEQFYLNKTVSQFLPTNNNTIAQCYINLSIIFQQSPVHDNADEPVAIQDNNSIPIIDLINSGGIESRTLIYGQAGIGKTTLIHKIAHMWANNEIWQGKFNYVFWLPLRQLTNKNYHTVEDFIYDTCTKNVGGVSKPEIDATKRAISNIIGNNHQDQILLLLDGYDELDLEKYPYAKDIIDKLFMFKNYILTSRPNAIDETIERKFNNIYENVGFTKDNIIEYIDRHPVIEKNEIKSFIKDKQELEEICGVPINLNLICTAWGEIKQGIQEGEEIKLTYIYDRITYYLLKRYLIRHDLISSNTSEKQIKNHPQYIQVEEILQKIAYQAMKDNRQILIKSQSIMGVLDKYCNISNNNINVEILREVGILRSVDPGTEIINNDHYFTHLTFEEYYAAMAVSKMLNSVEKKEKEEGIRFIEKNKYSQIYERMIGFVGGLLYQHNYTEAKKYFWHVIWNGNTDILLYKQARIMGICLKEMKGVEKINEEIREQVEKSNKKMSEDKRLEVTDITENDAGKIPEYRASQQIENIDKAKDLQKNNVISILQSKIQKDQEDDFQVKLKNLSDHYNGKSRLQNKDNYRLSTATDEINQNLSNLQNRNEYIRENAAETIGRIQTDSTQDKQKIINALLIAINDKESKVRGNAAKSLGNIQTDNKENKHNIIIALLLAIKDTKEWVIASAVEALGNIQTDNKEDKHNIIIALLLAIKDNKELVRRNAAEALSKIQADNKEDNYSIIIALLLAVQDNKYLVRGNAAKALGNIQTDNKEDKHNIITALLLAIQDDKYLVRGNAARSLSKIQADNKEDKYSIITALLSAIKDKIEWVRVNAARSLSKINDQCYSNIVIECDLPSLFNRYNDTSIIETIVDTLIHININNAQSKQAVLNQLFIMLKHEDAWIRHIVTNTLSNLKLDNEQDREQIVQAILPIIKDSNDIVRYAVIQSLNQIQINSEAITKQVTNQNFLLLTDPSPAVRNAVKQKLSKLNVNSADERKEITALLLDTLQQYLQQEQIDEAMITDTVYVLGVLSPFSTTMKQIFDKPKTATVFLQQPTLLYEIFLRNKDIQEGKIAVTLERFDNDYLIVIHENTCTEIKLAVDDKHFTQENIIEMFHEIVIAAKKAAKARALPLEMLHYKLDSTKPFEFKKTDEEIIAQTQDVIPTYTMMNKAKQSLTMIKEISISCKQWFLSLVRLNNKKHTFMLIEGKNVLGNSAFYRFELVQADPDIPKLTKLLVNRYFDVLAENVVQTFQRHILGNKGDEELVFNKGYYMLSIGKRALKRKEVRIIYEDVMEDFRIVEEDLEKVKQNSGKIEHNLYIPYSLRGNGAMFTDRNSHNCYTWAREKIKKNIPDLYEADKLESVLDKFGVEPMRFIKQQR